MMEEILIERTFIDKTMTYPETYRVIAQVADVYWICLEGKNWLTTKYVQLFRKEYSSKEEVLKKYIYICDHLKDFVEEVMNET